MKSILLTTIAAVVLVGCGLSMSIHDAAAVGDTKAVKQHIAAGTGVDAKDTNDALGMTPLHYAVANGHKEVIELLLVTAGVNVKTGNGLTPLDLAVSKGDKEIITILRKHGGKTGEELKVEEKISDTKQPETAKEDKKLWAKSYLSLKAPELIVEKWLSEKPEWKGKFLLVDFWATWCGPCLKAIPELNRFHEQFGEQMVVVGLSDEQESKVASMKQPQIEYYSAIDTQRRMKNEVKVTGIPHVLIIDPQGIVRWEGFPFLSGHELTEEVVENLLRKHGGKTGEELKAEGK
ncbi:ankyrin repeat domain-containing protein [bacterium]|nr:ankyrin repeat domain-containing protein [bacterium]